ncbi:MAG: hypothetical protein AAFR21_16230 [Pseudomonadota bacterium]
MSHQSNPVQFLAHEMDRFGLSTSAPEWSDILRQSNERFVTQRTPIYSDSKIGDRWILITSGLASSNYSHPDGRITLTRFFEPGHLAGNVTSTWGKVYGSDELFAITDVEGLEFPHSYLSQELLSGKTFGTYVRLKLVETLQFDKDLLVCKSLNEPEVGLKFLEERQASVLQFALKKDIAAFLGITAQAYSRILRRHSTD